MNIFTHPEEIKAISNRLQSVQPFAYTSNFNYYRLDGNIYSVFQEGTGTYPELISGDQIHSKAVWVHPNDKELMEATHIYNASL